jgi:phosphoserine aminotransferase
MAIKPTSKPNCPNFSSGPCAKRPGWSLDALSGAFLGRSHRASGGKAKLKDVIDLHKSILEIPDDYLVGIVAASDTGAIEMAMWSMLGARPVDVLVWENFGGEWMDDVVDQLKLKDANIIKVPYGSLPDLNKTSSDHDIVFTWNGTTSGVRIPDHNWIADDRTGLTFCDATSAVFAYQMDWSKLDITTWSWQKVLGGEAAHGMIVLSPRAVERLKTYTPDRALPKIFRFMKKGKLLEGVFVGETINTPSMLAVEDCLDALNWVKSLGGWKATQQRSINNLKAISEWVKQSNWIGFLSDREANISRTSICLKVIDPWFTALDEDTQKTKLKSIVSLLEKEQVAYDIGSYVTAPAGFRIWGGATVETSDIEALLPWLDWAYNDMKAKG